MLDSPTTAGAEPAYPSGATPDSPSRLIDIDELGHLLGCGKTKIYADLANPDSGIPRPVKNGRSTRWLLGEALAYISQLVAKRDAAKVGVQ
ncbi:MAG TPA: hypothetical protein VLC71_08205 [Thermomonas sp.]|nr:hypothetical protein [Thermomonas sp.]